MAEQNPANSGNEQDTQPRGKDKETGKPHKPVKIPIPKRDEIERLLKAATRGRRQ